MSAIIYSYTQAIQREERERMAEEINNAGVLVEGLSTNGDTFEE